MMGSPCSSEAESLGRLGQVERAFVRSASYRNARSTTQKLAAARRRAAAGIVMNHPRTMFLATPQRTAFTRFVAPTP